MNIIGYIRVSTDQQAESGLGLEAQQAAIHDYAKKNNITEVRMFGDEAISGAQSLDKRPGMLAAIAALSKNDVLVVAKRDRLGRDPMVLAMIESAVKRKGARIISVAGEGTESDEPSSILLRRMVDAFGEYERLIIGVRTKEALKVKKNKGERVGHIPFGKKIATNGIHLEPNEEEVETITIIAKMKKLKYSVRKIAAAINGQKKLNRGALWNHASMHRILQTLNQPFDKLRANGKEKPTSKKLTKLESKS